MGACPGKQILQVCVVQLDPLGSLQNHLAYPVSSSTMLVAFGCFGLKCHLLSTDCKRLYFTNCLFKLVCSTPHLNNPLDVYQSRIVLMYFCFLLCTMIQKHQMHQHSVYNVSLGRISLKFAGPVTIYFPPGITHDMVSVLRFGKIDLPKFWS